MEATSTKQKLLSLIEDVEIVSRELLDVISHPTRSKEIDTQKLVELLLHKDKEMKATLEQAKEQTVYQEKLDALRLEVELRDRDIKLLQQNMKDAESILANALYQAKQKLKSIDQANMNKVAPDELIKYAHKISSSNAVAAPPTWAPGDPRRPYPTEIDMRHSLLAKTLVEHSNRTAADLHNLSSTPHTSATSSTSQHHIPTQPSSLNGGAVLNIMHGSGGGLTNVSQLTSGYEHKQLHKEHEDVEMMSSDSSSSSSSDE